MLDYNTLNGFITKIKNKLSFKGKDTLKVDGKLMLDDATKLVDENGNKLIPEVLFENIKDSSGHLRFVEGDLSLETISGVTFKYSKWSLSGSHLMIILEGEVDNGTVMSPKTFATIPSMPQWIYDKLNTLWVNNSVEIVYVQFRSTTSTASSNAMISLRKTNDVLEIYSSYSENVSGKRAFRIQFDLIIDNGE